MRKHRTTFIDLKNCKFGKLTALGLTEKRKDGILYWNCLCECGNIKIIRGSILRKKSRSCGCVKIPIIRKRRKLKDEDYLAVSQLKARYQYDAKVRNLSFELTRQEFTYLTEQNCFYCEEEPANRHKHKTPEGDFYTHVYNGIDRVDNDKGYILSNCVSCCLPCNTKKKAVTVCMIRKIYDFIYGETNIEGVLYREKGHKEPKSDTKIVVISPWGDSDDLF